MPCCSVCGVEMGAGGVLFVDAIVGRGGGGHMGLWRLVGLVTVLCLGSCFVVLFVPFCSACDGVVMSVDVLIGRSMGGKSIRGSVLAVLVDTRWVRGLHGVRGW